MQNNMHKFIQEKFGYSYQMLYYALRGKRNLSFEKARRTANILNTDITLWINPEADPKERRAAWEKYLEHAKASSEMEVQQ